MPKMVGKTFLVEHLDEELGPWSELEYKTIAKESSDTGAKFCLSSVPAALTLPESLTTVPGFKADAQSVESLYAADKSRVCLLDPAAKQELSPEDGDTFDVFLFGGILGMVLSPQQSLPFVNADSRKGDDPPRGNSFYLTGQFRKRY